MRFQPQIELADELLAAMRCQEKVADEQQMKEVLRRLLSDTASEEDITKAAAYIDQHS